MKRRIIQGTKIQKQLLQPVSYHQHVWSEFVTCSDFALDEQTLFPAGSSYRSTLMWLLCYMCKKCQHHLSTAVQSNVLNLLLASPNCWQPPLRMNWLLCCGVAKWHLHVTWQPAGTLVGPVNSLENVKDWNLYVHVCWIFLHFSPTQKRLTYWSLTHIVRFQSVVWSFHFLRQEKLNNCLTDACGRQQTDWITSPIVL